MNPATAETHSAETSREWKRRYEKQCKGTTSRMMELESYKSRIRVLNKEVQQLREELEEARKSQDYGDQRRDADCGDGT